jgi:uncharacterized membrane protein
MKEIEAGGWSPYLAGALTGILIVVSVLLSGMYFGTSTSYFRTAAAIERFLLPDHYAATDYFSKYPPAIDWQLMFVVGIFFGALISSRSSRTFKWQAVPDMWSSRFGSGGAARGAVAFTGGVISLVGARLAGG